MMKGPSPDCVADGLQRLWAGGGQKAVRVDVPLPYRFPCSEIETEKVERLVRKISTPVCILAVDDLCLLRMQHQLAGRFLAAPEMVALSSRTRQARSAGAVRIPLSPGAQTIAPWSFRAT
jgi:hypothetical protein